MPDRPIRNLDPKPLIDPALLAEMENKINAAMAAPNGHRRAAAGVEVWGVLKSFANTPAVVAVRQRVCTELLEMDMALVKDPGPYLTVTHPDPEPPTVPLSTGSAVLPTGSPHWVVLLFTDTDAPDSATEAYVAYGDDREYVSANLAAPLARLRGCEFDVLEILPVPEVLGAQARVDAVRAVVIDLMTVAKFDSTKSIVDKYREGMKIIAEIVGQPFM